MMQSIWRLVRQSPTLTTLRLDQSLPTPKTALTPASFMYDTLEKLLDLVELEINDSSAVFDKVLERLPKLERFRAPSRFELTGRDDSRLLHQTFTGIKELELFGEADTRAVFSVLRYLPNLESLQLPGGFNQEFYENDYIQAKEAKERMDNTPSRLKRLSVGHHGFMDSRILISILPWIRDLTHFCFEGIDSSLARALATECKQLEVIREVENLEVDSVLHLLKGCPRLKVLDTINHRIKGGNFMDCTLACLGLETFRCQIVGMYWLNEDSTHILDRILLSNASDTPITDDEQALLAEVFENQERYRKVYRQLSRLTELRVLDLGQEYRVPYHWDYVLNDNNVSDEGHPYQWYRSPIEETLDLTLVSGLGQLETLKELEVFGFEGVDHRMDRTELEWMAVHWPKLRVMRGIHVDILPRVEPDPKRTELREYMQMLRPDVIHETLFELPTKRRQ
ncbi:hypothetical protein BGX29_006363 [Mortierella sp. GBA35]|nr:hypothetical protein BGX29_006363 [Mortierella sp. GBA35]